MMRWDPFRELGHLRDEMDYLLERFNPGPWMRALAGPRVDVYQTDDTVVARMDLPGLESKDDVEISVVGDTLYLRGQVNRTEEVQQQNYFHSERFRGQFARQIPLPVEVDAEKATASYRNGVLEVVLPKAPGQRRRNIPIDIH